MYRPEPPVHPEEIRTWRWPAAKRQESESGLYPDTPLAACCRQPQPHRPEESSKCRLRPEKPQHAVTTVCLSMFVVYGSPRRRARVSAPVAQPVQPQHAIVVMIPPSACVVTYYGQRGSGFYQKCQPSLAGSLPMVHSYWEAQLLARCRGNRAHVLVPPR